MRNSVKIALVVLAPIVSLGAVEAGFRYRAYERNQDTLGAAFNIPPIESPTGRVRFLDILPFHVDMRLNDFIGTQPDDMRKVNRRCIRFAHNHDEYLIVFPRHGFRHDSPMHNDSLSDINNLATL